MVVSTSVLSLYVLPKEKKTSDRSRSSWRPLAGFVVAKKVSKSACKRNRAKRQIREVYRLLRSEVFEGRREDIALQDWYAIVFVAHDRAIGADFNEIRASVTDVLVRASSRNRKDRRPPNSDQLVNK
jgi:ribonuclease P protein component